MHLYTIAKTFLGVGQATAGLTVRRLTFILYHGSYACHRRILSLWVTKKKNIML